MGHIVIAGGAGFLGQSLARFLVSAGHRVSVLSRSSTAPETGDHLRWDGRTLDGWAGALSGADALVNLAGRTVDCIKTPDHQDEILRSRVESTLILGEAMRAASAPPPVWVQMSTAHIYGDPPTARCVEDSAIGLGLAPTVGQRWEASFEEAKPPKTRGVILRTTFVLGRGGGALSRLASLARFGLGGTVGSGTQGMSWIHETDLNRIFDRAVSDATMEGVYLATGPEPEPNKVFMKRLRTVLRMPFGAPAPAFLVRLGAPLVLRTDPELALYGRYCVPQRLLNERFAFEFPSLEGALRDLLC